MSFNKHQIEAIKKIQNILRLEYINPEQVKKEFRNLQTILRNINTDFAKKFNNIKTPIDSNKFILSYLSKAISKETFNKILENYKKTNKIVFSREVLPIHKAEDDQDPILAAFEKLVSNAVDNAEDRNKKGKKNLFDTLSDLEKDMDKKGMTKEQKDAEAAKIGQKIGDDLTKKLKNGEKEEVEMLQDLLGSIGINDMGDLETLIALAPKIKDATDEELEKLADRLEEKIKKDNPQLWKKLDDGFDEEEKNPIKKVVSKIYYYNKNGEVIIEESHECNIKEKAFNEGVDSALKQLNFPSFEETNKATDEWIKERAKPEIQEKLKMGQTVKLKTPCVRNINGNSIKISEINTTSFEVRDPKKCTLLFIDENGKVHQMNKLVLEKGKFRIGKERGLVKNKEIEKTR